MKSVYISLIFKCNFTVVHSAILTYCRCVLLHIMPIKVNKNLNKKLHIYITNGKEQWIVLLKENLIQFSAQGHSHGRNVSFCTLCVTWDTQSFCSFSMTSIGIHAWGLPTTILIMKYAWWDLCIVLEQQEITLAL